MEADVLINLPKLKTHAQMLMTLGVKNLFGCIVGLRKPEWHFRTGVNREMFAELLVRIHNTVKPCLTIVDGILAMEGEGPGRSGTPRELGVIVGSDDAIALDIVICRMLGSTPDRSFTNRAARAMGCVPDDIEVLGEMPVIRAFKFPEIVPVVFGPEKLHGFMRRHLVQRPVPLDSLCTLCGECWQYCPAKAMTHDKKRIHLDYDKCIRCYCCIEVCPHGALRAEEPFMGKAIRKLKRR
jgi:ferredoxin